MRIAILSDIHGNLVALDAVLADIERHSPDEIWCGGDIAWGGPWPKECIARVRAAGWPTVKGNTDVWVTGDPQGVPEDVPPDHIAAMAQAHEISQEDSTWLLNLPLGHSGQGSLLLVHGTPETPFDAPMPDAPASAFQPYADQAQNVVYGHVHRSFVRRLADGTLVCNTGSVGLPMDGPTASYLLIDRNAADWTFRHRRVEFDRAAVRAEASRMEQIVADWMLERLPAS